jgi:glycosyltransferase involved in cell wall biosynthesis
MTAALLEPPVHVTTPRETARRRRVLLVAYCFPPVGGAGVQRPVKWVKYLERQGWDVTVLTPANPSVPVLDESLLAEIPVGTTFVRPKTWEPSYATKHQLAAKPGEQPGGWSPLRSLKRGISRFAKACLQPDPQILWYPNAVAAGSRALRQTPHDAILCTAPPYTSFLVGRALKQRFGLPLVLDYRDEWDLSSEYLEHAQRDGWSRWVQERQQQAVLRAADAVVATTQASVDRLGSRLDALGHAALRQCIYNGYDDEDFDEHYLDYATLPTTDRFRLVYTGTLWNLTDVAPVVAAIEQLHDRTPKLAARLEFVAIGRKTPEQQALLGRLGATACRVISRDYCEHSQVLAWQQSADALCLLLSDVPGAERVVPAKLFEYLATQRALLGVTPTGETTSILERFHPDSRFAPRDVAGICRWLQQQLTMDQEPAERYSRNDLREFSRGSQTARLASLLDQLTAARAAGGRP